MEKLGATIYNMAISIGRLRTCQLSLWGRRVKQDGLTLSYGRIPKVGGFIWVIPFNPERHTTLTLVRVWVASQTPAVFHDFIDVQIHI